MNSLPPDYPPASGGPGYAPPSAPAAIPVSVTSDTSKEIQLIVRNHSTNKQVDLVWVDFSGQENAYNQLPPGQMAEQGTWSTHIWRLKSNNQLLVQYSGPSAELVVYDQGVFVTAL